MSEARKFTIGQEVVITAPVHPYSDLIEAGTTGTISRFVDYDQGRNGPWYVIGGVQAASGRLFDSLLFAEGELSAVETGN
ncbi:hypothetical protein BayCH28_22250 [Mycolicibacterium sp. CH28]|uniref:hypothetical protein n=1 Tax=Mycolicibacterium sp. CH28 TaxID=2512237 RepID=UPI0010802214|nr:hypothetical protein [Mycolicibacterium sp. CH28]TGD85126.1 hypothetical protein BayCH28_22250 [Mycolicibacterium sp. CH28]